MKYLIAILVAGVLCLIGASALAAGPSPDDPMSILSAVLNAFQGRNWPFVVAGLVMLAVWAVRTKATWLTAKVPWLATRWGGYALAAGLAVLPVVAQGLFDSVAWAEVVRRCVVALAVAIAGWGAVKDVKAGGK